MQGAYEGMLRICILPTAEYMLDLCNSKIFCQEATSLQEERPDISLKKKNLSSKYFRSSIVEILDEDCNPTQVAESVLQWMRKAWLI